MIFSTDNIDVVPTTELLAQTGGSAYHLSVLPAFDRQRIFGPSLWLEVGITPSP
jgi:hypothetical protein